MGRPACGLGNLAHAIGSSCRHAREQSMGAPCSIYALALTCSPSYRAGKMAVCVSPYTPDVRCAHAAARPAARPLRLPLTTCMGCPLARLPAGWQAACSLPGQCAARPQPVCPGRSSWSQVFCSPNDPPESYEGYGIRTFEAVAQHTPWLQDFGSWGYRCGQALVGRGTAVSEHQRPRHHRLHGGAPGAPRPIMQPQPRPPPTTPIWPPGVWDGMR